MLLVVAVDQIVVHQADDLMVNTGVVRVEEEFTMDVEACCCLGEPSERDKNKREERAVLYLAAEDRCRKLARIEHGDHLANEIVVLRVRHVRFEADVGEVRLRRDMNGEIMSIGKKTIH